MPLHDIRDKEDVYLLVNSFYDKVKDDSTIGYFFNDIAKINWSSHLPIMYQFWESVIFESGIYKGNPMLTHILLNKKEALEKKHFEKWMKLWSETVDTHFKGEKAESAKNKAHLMVELMMHKIDKSKDLNFIQ